MKQRRFDRRTQLAGREGDRKDSTHPLNLACAQQLAPRDQALDRIRADQCHCSERRRSSKAHLIGVYETYHRFDRNIVEFMAYRFENPLHVDADTRDILNSVRSIFASDKETVVSPTMECAGHDSNKASKILRVDREAPCGADDEVVDVGSPTTNPPIMKHSNPGN